MKATEGDALFHRAIMAGVKKGFRVAAVIQAMYECLGSAYGDRWIDVARHIFGPANYLEERAELVETFRKARALGTLSSVARPTRSPDEITINSLKLHYFRNLTAELEGAVEQAPKENVSNKTSPAYEICLTLYFEGKWYVIREPLVEIDLERKRKTSKTRVPRLMGLMVSTRCLLGVGSYESYDRVTTGISLNDLEIMSEPIPYFLEGEMEGEDDVSNPRIPQAPKSHLYAEDYEAWESIYHTDPKREAIANRVNKKTTPYLKGTKIPRRFVPPVLEIIRKAKKKTLRWAPDVVSPKRPPPSDSWLGEIEEED